MSVLQMMLTNIVVARQIAKKHGAMGAYRSQTVKLEHVLDHSRAFATNARKV